MRNNYMIRKKEIIALFLILTLGFIVRLYKFTNPIADWHSWRQSDTSSVSRNFVKYGFDLLHPRFDDLSNGVSLLDNPKGYRFVEFPIYNVFQAGLFELFHTFTIEEWGRLVSIASVLIATVFLYLFVREYVSSRAGLFAAFFYALLPYNIYFGRVILPDTLMVAFMLGGLYFFDAWTKKIKTNQKRVQALLFFMLAVLFTASAILIKPFVLFYGLAFVYILIKRFGWRLLKRWDIWLFAILCLLPFVLWRAWMQQYPEGIPRNDWLYNGNGIRFRGAFFWWIFAERIGKNMLGYWSLPIIVIGLISKIKEKDTWFFFTFIIASLLYISVFATGNVQHDYYQILIVPTLAIFFAKGAEAIVEFSSHAFHKFLALATFAICVVFMFMFGWREIRAFYNIDHPEIVEAGRAIDALTPKNAKIIAIYNGDTTFLYHTNRQGWPVFERSIKDFVKAGATHIAFVNQGEKESNFANEFNTVKVTERYAIFDLTKKKK